MIYRSLRVLSHNIWAVVVFLLIVATFFSPAVFQGKLPVPSDALVGLYHPWRDLYSSTYPRGVPFKNFLITDPVRQQIPWRSATITLWKNARFPWWNPYSFAGTPLAANIQAAVFYPLNILFFILPFPVGWTVLILLQPVLGGLFFFMFLRSLKLSIWASLFGSIAWSFGGFSVAWLTWGTMGHVMAWLPLVLFAIDRVIQGEKQKRWTLVFGGSLAMSLFAGHSQIFFYVLLFSISYALWRLSGQNSQVRSESGKWLLTGLIASAVVTSIQWVPLLSFLPETSRFAEPDVWKKSGWFIPWQHLVQFLAPDFFGNPTTLNYWGEWNYAEFVGYVGIIPLVFALGALKAKEMRFWLGALVISLLFALPSPLAKLPYVLQIPILSSLQPTRLLSIVTFVLSVLTAFGVDAWQKEGKRIQWPVILIALLLGLLWSVVLFGLRIGVDINPENLEVAKRNLLLPTGIFTSGIIVYFLASFKPLRHIGLVALIIISAFDLLRFGWKFTPFTPQSYFFPVTKTLVFLKSQPSPFRIMVTDDKLLPPNTASYYNLETAGGYDPLYSTRYEEFIAALERGKPDVSRPFGFNRIISPANIDSPLLPYLNVRYVLSLTDLERPFLHKIFQEGTTRVYENARVLPRVYLAEQVSSAKDSSEIIEKLYKAGPFLTKTGIVDRAIPVQDNPLTQAEIVELLSYRIDGSMHMRVQTTQPRLLIILNNYDKGWSATVDGVKTPIYRTNYTFQGILVPPGDHGVEVAFH